ncbi:MAG: tyrosine-type recombinase/integrase, partial [Rhodococcus sp. (in: high G+C Gram-positive bacteria)]
MTFLSSAAQVERMAQAIAEVADEAHSEDGATVGLLVRFAAQTGMRAGEMCGLRWENVDLLRNRVTGCESISTINSGGWCVVTRLSEIPQPRSP